MMVINEWTILAHPLLLDQMEKLTRAVEKQQLKNSQGYRNTADAKLLAALRKLMFETIPADPARRDYRQGATLGSSRKHWFRAKFGGARFRLFFRYDSQAKIIVFAWVNDQKTLRTYGAKTDAYAVFKTMLDRGNPPDDWTTLEKEASHEAARQRLEAAKPD